MPPKYSGVQAAGLSSFLPANGNQGNSAFVAEGYVPPKPGTIDLATPIQVQGDIFRAMGIPLLRGRLFTDADSQPPAQLVVIVNQQLAQQSWPAQNPIGKRMRPGLAHATFGFSPTTLGQPEKPPFVTYSAPAPRQFTTLGERGLQILKLIP